MQHKMFCVKIAYSRCLIYVDLVKRHETNGVFLYKKRKELKLTSVLKGVFT